MSKNELELISFNIGNINNQIYIEEVENLQDFNNIITHIFYILEFSYKILRNDIINIFNKYDLQNTNTKDVIELFEGMDRQKDNIMSIERYYNYWYEENCFMSKEGFVIIENFNYFFKDFYNKIKNIIKHNDNIKDMLKNIDIDLYKAIDNDLKFSYIPTTENLNKYIKEINKLIESFKEYAIRVEED